MQQMTEPGRRPRAATRIVALALLAAPLLAACVGSPAEGPREFWNNAFGEPLQGRPLPPGTDGAYPNLASVPPQPPRGTASAREALSAALAEARGQSREPVVAGRPVPPPPAGGQGDTAIPLNPPTPPRLASAPPIRPMAPGEGNLPSDPALPADPGRAPGLPPAEMLAPSPGGPPPPARGLGPAPAAPDPAGVPPPPRL
ncbi:hypothetical protein [Roseomonas sp. 18066]|uniref:hypothetical protein n=1 Tax=Roseomonas sp. 18066 TaxID=2681412 RepID=UPI00135929C8|nr:hypothetical protein [Roseomonas sp. 18066]